MTLTLPISLSEAHRNLGNEPAKVLLQAGQTVSAGHGLAPGFRVAWFTERADLDVASFRYRCLIPALSIDDLSIRSVFPKRGEAAVAQADLFVFVKCFGMADLALAHELKRHGKPFILDLCDNIFTEAYTSQLRFADRRIFQEMAAIASAIVVTGPALAEAVNRLLPPGLTATIIPDAAVSRQDHQRLTSWYQMLSNAQAFHHEMATQTAASGAVSFPSLVLETSERLIKRAQRRVRYFLRHPQALSAPLFRLFGGQGDALPRNGTTKKVVWFGKHGTSHSDAGMKALLRVLPHLQEISRNVPVELVIISNNRAKFDAHFRALGITTRYRAWSNAAVYEELTKASAFLMPNASDPFSACKSANRALLALAAGVPVIADQLDSLEPLRGAIVVDDWRSGLQRYLLSSRERDKDVALAQRIIDEQYAFKAIGLSWTKLIERVI
jgi:glycosyltransferase involved in cell wall biosynthesis